MSADTTPIPPARFASALKDLSINMLHLKVLEIRNSIAHLQYSNDQLKPFAEGSAVATVGSPSTNNVQSAAAAAAAAAEPDQDCIDAIRENEQVIDRMAERLALIRAEVEERGISWTEFQSAEELEQQNKKKEEQILLNGEAAADWDVDEQSSDATTSSTRHSAWTDGTFETGTIRGWRVNTSSQSRRPGAQGQGDGGSLSDEQLRAALEERIRNLATEDNDDNDEDGGLHL